MVRINGEFGDMIEVSSLSKSYKIFKRRPGVVNSLKSIFKREYEEVKAVKDISFSIARGEFVGFIGPNGAGKTTTLKMLSGILYPSTGKITVNGFSPHKKNPQFLRQISLISAQKNNLWWDIPPKDSFLIHKVIYEIHDDDFKRRVHELSEMLDVASLLDVPVRNLSLGERMKMEIMMSILHNPSIIFLDEPTIGLDFVSRQQIKKFLINYHKTHKSTIILTSHYFEDIADLTKRLIIINGGSIVSDTPINQIQQKYQDYKIVRVRSEKHRKFKEQFESNIVNENMEFIEILLSNAQIKEIFQSESDEEFEIKPVSLEAMVKQHYDG